MAQEDMRRRRVCAHLNRGRRVLHQLAKGHHEAVDGIDLNIVGGRVVSQGNLSTVQSWRLRDPSHHSAEPPCVLWQLEGTACSILVIVGDQHREDVVIVHGGDIWR